jgi:hypothetical protein
MINFIQEYIKQAISIAANNLRLSSEKIETVAILKDHISKSNDLAGELTRMKKITELSRLGIKLGEILSYFDANQIDFLNLSENFKEQSHSLIMILSNMLDVVTPKHLSELLFQEFDEPERITIEEDKSNDETETAPLKEELIMEELDSQKVKTFEEFQLQILKPVRSIEDFLTRLSAGDYHKDELEGYVEIMKINAERCEERGVKVISHMHIIFAVGMKLILNDKLVINKSVIESLRASLIVIVAMIKGKNIDITAYLNKAEKFGEQILQYK